jgi:murein DD-endopeptidase MepM/ murein hydrolase activator NlpD
MSAATSLYLLNSAILKMQFRSLFGCCCALAPFRNPKLRRRNKTSHLWFLARCFFLSLFAVPSVYSVPNGGGVQIRFYPSRNLRVYEVDARHGFSGALLQNAAIINSSEKSITFERAELELLSGESALQVHNLSRADLERAVKRGLTIQKAGLLEKFAFQFRPEVLLGKETTLTDGLTVAPKAAILLGQRYLVFAGAPDQVRLRALGRAADGTSVEAEGSLAILMKSSEVEYDFPVAGRWFVGVGQDLHNPHRWVVPEEFALDLVKLGSNASTHLGNGAKRSDYYAYGETVLAAADGTVTAVQDSIPETDSNLQQPGETAQAYQTRVLAMQDELLAKGALRAAGNYVLLQHTEGEYSFYAHLLPGSVRVHSGEQIKRGQPIAKLGHSGNSTEPHLHFHVVDGPDPLLSAGIPLRFRNISLPFAGEERALHDGDIVDTR